MSKTKKRRSFRAELLAGGTDVETTVQRLQASVDCRSDASGVGPS